MLGVVLITSVVSYFSGIISFDNNEINTTAIEVESIDKVKEPSIPETIKI